MGILSNIDDTIQQSDEHIELLFLPNSSQAIKLFKKTRLDAKGIWLYQYKFECPNILKKFNEVVRPRFNYSGFEITIAVKCNHGETNGKTTSFMDNATVTYTIQMNMENGLFTILDNSTSTYYPRADLEVLADALFQLKLSSTFSIFKNKTSIYCYLNGVDKFRGYDLMQFV